MKKVHMALCSILMLLCVSSVSSAQLGDTAYGSLALYDDTTGQYNTAVGWWTLYFNSTGSFNVGLGAQALFYTTTGQSNTGVGTSAGFTNDASNMTGSNNTFLGAGAEPSTGSLNNATAIGANAEVDESNALVLGSINGVNGQTVSTKVGIGTTKPQFPLQVEGNSNTSTGVQTRTINDSTSGKSYALDSLVAGGGAVNTEMLADGLGTGPLGTPGGVFGTFSNNPIGFITGNALRMSISSAYILTSVGVGIGAVPDSLLTVNGSADKPGGGSWGTYSDGRLKTVKGGFTDGLSQVMKIHPVHYRYKPDNAMGIRDTDEHIGVVAQDVQKVIPEAVTENSKGYLLVNNDPIIWTMLNAIKEQQEEVQHEQAASKQQQAELAKALRL